MSRLQIELAHMQRLLSTPTSFQSWKAYLWDKAKRLAESDAEFSELPRLLAEAMKSQPREAEQ